MTHVSRRAGCRWWHVATLMTVTLALTASAVVAQVLYGSVVGVVKDPQGGFVPGATVSIINKDTNLTRDAVTDAQGAYTFNNVQAGSYDVKVNLQGFRENVRTQVPVTIGQISRVDITLEVGTVSETLTSYGPARTLVRLKLPSASVTVSRVRLVSLLTIVTVAPGTLAPWASVTVPTMLP